MVLSLPDQSSETNRSAKQVSMIEIMALVAVDAPGDAPNRAARDPSLAEITSVPNSNLPFVSFPG